MFRRVALNCFVAILFIALRQLRAALVFNGSHPCSECFVATVEDSRQTLQTPVIFMFKAIHFSVPLLCCVIFKIISRVWHVSCLLFWFGVVPSLDTASNLDPTSLDMFLPIVNLNIAALIMPLFLNKLNCLLCDTGVKFDLIVAQWLCVSVKVQNMQKECNFQDFFYLRTSLKWIFSLMTKPRTFFPNHLNAKLYKNKAPLRSIDCFP